MLIFYPLFKMKLKDASLKHQTGRNILVLSQTEEIYTTKLTTMLSTLMMYTFVPC